MSEFKEGEKSEEEGGEKKLKLMQRKMAISPNIQRMSEVFEKREKFIPKNMSKGENVSKLKSSFEIMMNDTKTRKTSFEIKRRKKKNVSLEETPRRTALDLWVEKEKSQIYSNNTNTKSKSVNINPKSGQVLSKHGEIGNSILESRHRKRIASEKLILNENKVRLL